MLSIRHRGILSLALALPLLAACGGDEADELDVPPVTEAPVEAEADVTTAPTEIAAQSEGYAAAWNAEDPAAVAAFFTEDATATAGDSTYTGRDEIQQGWIAPALPGISDLTATESSYERQGDQIIESGRFSYTATAEDGSTQQATGTFTHVWVQDADGTWRISSVDVQSDA